MSNILSALRLLDVNSKAASKLRGCYWCYRCWTLMKINFLFAVSLIKLFEVLGCYSMRPRILKETLLLLRTSTNGDQVR